jgi:NDP-sugar pyrophosphorylase family protein
MRYTPNVTDALLLCGGAGVRLRSVTGNAPKSLATIGQRPFLDLLLSQLRRHGVKRVILAVGYQKDLIRLHYGETAFGLRLIYSEESEPLGTGGAVRDAAKFLESETVLITNGDSYTNADLGALAAGHLAAKSDVSVVVVASDGRTDAGFVSVDSDARVLGFREKQSSAGPQYLNAGVYIATRSALRDVRPGLRVSLEEEIFPQWLSEGKLIRAFVHQGQCVDIGTPERYQIAQGLLATAELDPSGVATIRPLKREFPSNYGRNRE